MQDKIPAELHSLITVATDKIGELRAIIALQSLIHVNHPLRIIDGVLRQETLDGIESILKTHEIEALAKLYVEKIEGRFPGTFAAPVSDEGEFDTVAPAEFEDPVDEDLVPVIAPRRKRKSDG